MSNVDTVTKVKTFLTELNDNRGFTFHQFLNILVEAKTLWLLGMPLFLPSCLVFALAYSAGQKARASMQQFRS